MFQGLRTICYPVADLAQGKAWYSQVLERSPYFDQPFYVGFDVNGFELGLIPDGQPGAVGPTTYWSVPDVERELQRLLQLGAMPHEPVTDVGGGIKVASVLDPFGNIVGIIHVPSTQAHE